jgi:hypothetical protein
MPKTTMPGDVDREDYDETRRLMYMALLRQRTEKYELAGTLVNALTHHHSVTLPVNEIITHVLAVIENDDEDSVIWMQNQIGRISDQLGD